MQHTSLESRATGRQTSSPSPFIGTALYPGFKTYLSLYDLNRSHLTTSTSCFDTLAGFLHRRPTRLFLGLTRRLKPRGSPSARNVAWLIRWLWCFCRRRCFFPAIRAFGPILRGFAACLNIAGKLPASEAPGIEFAIYHFRAALGDGWIKESWR